MEQALSAKPRKMKGMVFIIIISIIAILCRGVGFISDTVNIIKTLIDVFQYGDFSRFDFAYAVSLVAFGFEVLATPIFALMEVLPFILLMVYACFCFRRSKGTVLMPIAIGTVALTVLVNFVKNAVDLLVTLIEGGEHIQYMLETYIPIILESLAYSFSYIIIVVACVLAIVAAIKGFTNKALAITSSAIGIGAYCLFALTKLINCIVVVIDGFKYIEEIKENYISMGGFYQHVGEQYIAEAQDHMWSNIGSTVVALIVCFGLMLFFVALLILAIKNYIPEMIPMSEDKLDNLIVTKPRAALGIYKMRYECGKLSEEEYNTRVASIENRA